MLFGGKIENKFPSVTHKNLKIEWPKNSVSIKGSK